LRHGCQIELKMSADSCFMCHGFGFLKQNDYFRVDLDHFWNERYFFEAAVA